MTEAPAQPLLDTQALRASIRDEYAAVATEPERGFNFHTGRSLAALLGYPDAWVDALPPVDAIVGRDRRHRFILARTAGASQ